MSRFGARGALSLGVLALLLSVGAWLARTAVLDRVESALTAKGLTWAARQDTVLTSTWVRIKGPGIRAARLHFVLLPAPTASIEDVEVDAEALSQARARASKPANEPAPADVDHALAGETVGAGIPLHAKNVRVSWGSIALLENANGTLAPDLQLRGDGGEIARTDQGWRARIDRDLNHSALSGSAHLEVQCDAQTCEGIAFVDHPILRHPLLAPRPVALQRLRIDGTWTLANGALQAHAFVGPLQANIAGAVTADPFRGDLRITVQDALLEDVVAIFGPQIPEAARSRIVGTVGLTALIALPDMTWSVTPRAVGIGAEGVIRDAFELRDGTVEWKANGATEDDWTIKRAGRGQPHWTSLEAAGLVPAAVMAAEDSSFWRHKGYDLGAIKAALDEKTAAPESTLRGGSTLTQQLAKNLFLDGRDRTLTRKLRELLYALELERLLRKDRILELYLNIVELGPRLHGIGAASDAYFLKAPDRLTAREAVFLAAILPSPRARGERAWLGGATPNNRIEAVLDNMVDAKALTASHAARAKRSELRFVPPPRATRPR